jgi:hypothetical protein
MKKIFTLTLMALCILQAQAQSAEDALRYSQNFYMGTARSAAMGNAMTALGGDFGSLSINPAGSAIYPFSEIVFTPALHGTTTQSNYLGNTLNETRVRPGFTNLGYIGSYPTGNRSSHGLISFNLAVGYNALNNFTESFRATGSTAESSWLSSLASQLDGVVHATDMDWNNQQNPFYGSDASWKALLAWNASLLDTLPGSGGWGYKGANEIYFGDDSFGQPSAMRQEYSRKTQGNVGEYLINGSVNISNKLFAGVSLGFQSIWYKTSEYYSETAERPNDFLGQTDFGGFTHNYNQSSSGVGFNMKFGIIYVPVKFLRLGASIHTPTWMRLHDEWDETIDARFTAGTPQNIYLESPIGEYTYKVHTPFRWNVGGAITLGPLGVFSVDYEQVAYDKIRMKGTNNFNPFGNDNNYIRRQYQTAHNLRLGAEFNLMAFSIRGGYAYYGSPEKEFETENHIVSGGVGYQNNGFFIDLTYLQRLERKEYFSLYDDVVGYGYTTPAPVGEQISSNWKFLLSFGFRF